MKRQQSRFSIGPAKRFNGIGFIAFLYTLAFLQSAVWSQDNESATVADKTNPIVIVHGAWGGAHHWKATARFLEKNWDGPIYRATLTGQGERVHLASPSINLTTHINDVKSLIDFEELENVILLGHSYGGVVISGVTDAIPEKIHKRIYLDATLLDNGENFFSRDPAYRQKLEASAKAGGDGWKIPVSWPNKMRDVAHPLATLTENLVLKNPLREKVPAEYWLFTDGGTVENDGSYFYYQRAEARGYQVKDFLWGHNPHRDDPEALGRALLKSFRP